MSDMMPSTRFCPKASSIISKRKNRNCSHSLKASSMRKSLAHKWKLGNKNFNDSLTSARAREALNQKIALEGGKEDKALPRKREGKQPACGDSLNETRPFQCRCHGRKRTASKHEGGYNAPGRSNDQGCRSHKLYRPIERSGGQNERPRRWTHPGLRGR